MEDPLLHKIAISGPTLASIIQRFSTSHGAVDGLLFGHVTYVTPSTLFDDSASAVDSDPLTLVATITAFFCSDSINTVYDSTGTVEPTSLRRFLGDPHHSTLLGWFSGRRKTQLRPSMREFLLSSSLSSMTHFSSPIKNAPEPTNLKPCVFLLFASPLWDQTIHTHEYRAYQFRSATESFDPKSIDIVNIGPAFRGHYGSFNPNSPFPWLSMNGDRDDGSLNPMKEVSNEQRVLDMNADGFEVGRLSQLMGVGANKYAEGLEDLYEKMLVKIENLARLVEKSSARVLEQENHNRKLKGKILKSIASE